MSLLTIVQGAVNRLGLPPLSAVVTSTDTTAVEMQALAQAEGKELAARAEWKILTKEQVFSATNAAAQAGGLPSDLGWIIPETLFNRTLRRKFSGPLNQEEWQYIQANLTTLVWPAFRVRGTSLLITPSPSAGDIIAYEYVSNQWCQSSGGTPQSAWGDDSDTALIDEELHTLGLIWRFKKAKGLDYADDFRIYDLQVRQAIYREGSRPKISSDPSFRLSRHGADALAAARGDIILSDDGAGLMWD